jgi:hypothetical protein
LREMESDPNSLRRPLLPATSNQTPAASIL